MMHFRITAAIVTFASWSALGGGVAGADKIPWPSGLPTYDHVVIVIEENKDYEQVMDPARAPYINGVLAKEGAVLTQMYGEEHPSQGNYFWLFSGSNQGVGFADQVPGSAAQPTPFTASNLAQQLLARQKTFRGYSEDLPAAGFTGALAPEPEAAGHSPKGKVKGALYARKHVPWVSFSNIGNGDLRTIHVPFTDFPTDFSQLPTVAFVIPNLKHDMHDGAPEVSVPHGDAWLQKNLDAYYQWARQHNSLLILTCDENDDIEGYSGLTNPSAGPPETVKEVDLHHGPDDPQHRRLRHDLLNHITTILAGAHIKPGFYAEGPGVTHVNILRTIESMYGLPKSGAQQANAAGFGLSDDYIITDVFQP